MKRSPFRLATVLRVRHVQEDVELGRLSLARADARRAADRADASLDSYRRQTTEGSSMASTGAFLAERLHAERLAESVTRARADVVTSQQIVADRRVDWSFAAQRVSALVRLRDRHNEAFAAAALLEDVLDADERTTARRHLLSLPNAPAESR